MAAPTKIIHIVESLGRGAVENWLLRMLAHARANGAALDWTFYCQLPQAGERDDQARAMGARIVHSEVPLVRTRAFMTALRGELRRGRYDVLHCHHDLVSAVYLATSFGLPIGRHIVHAHNADEGLPTPSRTKAALLRGPMRRICLTADKVVGISGHTLGTMLGGRARRAGRDVVHYYGIDPAPFIHARGDRTAFRRSIGLPDDALLLLFGGRITPEKNPVYAIDVFARIAAREPRAFMIYVGSGSLEGAVAERAKALGVADRVRMMGWRNDLPDIMCSADWFILPHPEEPMEGFGLAVVEAQLAGLPLLLSHGIPDDPLLPTAVFRRLSLADDPDRWADAAMDLLSQPAPSGAAALAALKLSPMDMDFALADLLALYA